MSALLRLVRVEFRRLVHRRAILVLIAACLVVPTIIGVVRILDTRPASDAEIADAQAQLERDLKDPGYQQTIEDCIASPEEWGLAGTPEDEIDKACRENNEPRLDWYLYSPQLDLAEDRDDGSGIAVALVLGLAMVLLGTTFTGYDWSSGSVSNQLLFEPRRSRVWSAKALVVTVTAGLIAAVVMSSYWLVLNAVASSRDLPGGGAMLLDCLQMGWRTSVVVGLGAFAGFALTTLFRSTVATLGVLFGVALLGGVLLAAIGVEGRWNPALNLVAVIADGTTYYAEMPCPPGSDADGSYCSGEKEISFAQGAGFLGTAVAGAGLVSLLTFRRRDVP